LKSNRGKVSVIREEKSGQEKGRVYKEGEERRNEKETSGEGKTGRGRSEGKRKVNVLGFRIAFRRLCLTCNF